MEERLEKKGSPAQTNPKKKKRKAPEKPHETSSPRQTDDAAERQDETRKVEDQRKAEVEDTRKDIETDTDDEKKRQMGHSDVAVESQKSPETNKLDDQRQDDVEPKRRSAERDADDGNKGQIRQNNTDEVQKTSDEALNSQTGGEESTAETGKNVLDDEVGSQTESEREPSNREKPREEKDDRAGEPECERFGSHDKDNESDIRSEISHIRDMKTDENCGTASEAENSVDVEAQDNLNVNVGEQSKDSSEQHLDEETKEEKEEQRVTPPQRPLHGLYNQGATCYLNSVLQVLFMTTEIHDRLNQQPDQELRKIFKDLKRKTCETKNITKSLKIENVHEQRDAAECLQEILHHISPEASEVFQGQLRDTTKCFKDHIIIEEINPFWTLPLSLNDSNDTTYSVESSFKRTFETKKYSSDNMVYCNDCKQKTEATSNCEMVEAPQILILLLKRFDFDYTTMSHFKSDCCVEVPCELQLENKTYKLYGMVNHMGSLTGGHYTATVLSEDNTWYECNDEHVSKVKHMLFAEDGNFSSRTVYLLTYRATELEMSCETRQTEEGEVQTRNDNEVLNHQTEGEEDNAEEHLNNKPEGLKETSTVWGKLKNWFNSVFQKKRFSSSKATECQKPVETPTEDPTDKEKEEQCDHIGPEEHKEPKRNSKIKTDDEETTQMRHSAEDEGQLKKDSKEERLQARGKGGDTTVSEVKSSEDEEAEENEDSNTRKNSESAEFKDIRL